MKITINRDGNLVDYEVSSNLMLLQALYEIKENQDASLSFDSGCRSMVCGACAVRVNGKEKLACGYKVEENDTIEPLRAHEVIKDLKVKKYPTLKSIKDAKCYIKEYKEECITPQDEAKSAIQSDCILCDSCYSACPVFEVNKDFLGPFALTRAYRYAIDKRENNPKEIIDAIQQNGVWDCTLCGECTLACPKGIDPKTDIMMLRNLSAQHGYMDPNLTVGFGFNPNGF
jgi:fumarate reductase iron-sulfur subunit